MTAFATSDDAAGYAYPLPDVSADGLLARATQALTDAAGFGILEADATVRMLAERGLLRFTDVPLVTAVTEVASVGDDGTSTALDGADWSWLQYSQDQPVALEHTVAGFRDGLFEVTLTQGLTSAPASLKMLTCQLAYRFAAMPPAMAAGIVSRSVGGVSWSAASPPPTGDLTAGELSKLAKIVPVRRAWQVPSP